MPTTLLVPVSTLTDSDLEKMRAAQRLAYARHIQEASASRRLIRRLEAELARRAKEVPDGS